MKWGQAITIESRQYRCGYCGYSVASAQGYYSDPSNVIYICPHCGKPTYFTYGEQVPGVAPGNDIDHLPEDVAALYDEARRCVSVSSHTAAVLACRKLLMNIGVAQGAKEGEDFLYYVDHLASTGYVPPNGKAWVDHIRKKGNEATHEIVPMSRGDAEELISFVEMLLKFIYEFPSKVPKT